MISVLSQLFARSELADEDEHYESHSKLLTATLDPRPSTLDPPSAKLSHRSTQLGVGAINFLEQRENMHILQLLSNSRYH